MLPERVNTDALPTLLLSSSAPINAVDPSPDKATLAPKLVTFALFSFGPCCVHVLPDRVNTHAAPTELSSSPPISAVFPSAERATLTPNWEGLL